MAGLQLSINGRFWVSTEDSHAKRELFEYIEAFYNTRRRHSTLDYLSPAEFERRFRSGGGKEHCA